jgi:ABC-type hemin transport system ATPase subunit
VGIGGPVGSGKTALMLQLCKSMRDNAKVQQPDVYANSFPQLVVVVLVRSILCQIPSLCLLIFNLPWLWWETVN